MKCSWSSGRHRIDEMIKLAGIKISVSIGWLMFSVKHIAW